MSLVESTSDTLCQSAETCWQCAKSGMYIWYNPVNGRINLVLVGRFSESSTVRPPWGGSEWALTPKFLLEHCSPFLAVRWILEIRRQVFLEIVSSLVMIDLEWILWEGKPYQTFFNYTPANGKSTCHIAASKKTNYSLLTPKFFIFGTFRDTKTIFRTMMRCFLETSWDVSLNPPRLCTPNPIAIRISLIQLFPALDSLDLHREGVWSDVPYYVYSFVIFWPVFCTPRAFRINSYLL